MKKTRIISLILVMALIIAAFTVNFSVSGDQGKIGDANSDGSVNMKDVLVMRKYIAGMAVTIDLDAADVNFDGRINMKDVLLMRKQIAGIVEITRPVTTTTEPETTVKKKYIALTFDDGPNTFATPDILKKLKLHKIKATFFLIGCNIKADTIPVVQSAIDQGHEIENHSYYHNDMSSWTPEKIKADVGKTDQLIYDNFGIHTSYFRPPMLATSNEMYENIDQVFIAGFGTNDWDTNVGEEEVIEKIEKNACDGMIILLHDSQSKNAAVVSKIAPYLKNKGYEFVTVSELFKIKGVVPQEYEMFSYVN